MALSFSLALNSDPIAQAMNVSYVSKLHCYLLEGNYNMDLVNRILNQDPSAFNPDRSSLLIRSPICIALRCSASKDTIRQLLEAGCSPNVCTTHNSVLHCASDHMETRFNTDVLTMLIQDGADWKRNDMQGRSPLCYALRRTTDKSFINLLFNKGCRLNSCKHHETAMICLMNRDPGVLLTASVIKLLCQEGVDPYMPNKENCIPLNLALRSGVFEIQAIEALVDLVEAHPTNSYSSWTQTSICNAIMNPQCQVSTLELLIQRGASITLTNTEGFTPLHLVASMPNCCPKIIKLLSNNNRKKNRLNSLEKSPLQTCIENNDETIPTLMFVAGCRLNSSRVYYYVEIRMNNSKILSFRKPEVVHLLKMLIKFGFLEKPDFNGNAFLQDNTLPYLFEYAEACKLEISNMKDIDLFKGLTMYDFVVPKLNAMQDPIITPLMRTVHLNLLVEAMVRHNFNIYNNIIAAYFPMSAFKDTLDEIWGYLGSLDSLPNGEKVMFNWDFVLQLCDYLLPEDALNLILAYKPYVP